MMERRGGVCSGTTQVGVCSGATQGRAGGRAEQAGRGAGAALHPPPLKLHRHEAGAARTLPGGA